MDVPFKISFRFCPGGYTKYNGLSPFIRVNYKNRPCGLVIFALSVPLLRGCDDDDLIESVWSQTKFEIIRVLAGQTNSEGDVMKVTSHLISWQLIELQPWRCLKRDLLAETDLVRKEVRVFLW